MLVSKGHRVVTNKGRQTNDITQYMILQIVEQQKRLGCLTQ
jgi:hypothetical protein